MLPPWLKGGGILGGSGRHGYEGYVILWCCFLTGGGGRGVWMQLCGRINWDVGGVGSADDERGVEA